MRKGRFDEIFFVDLPDSNERKKIFSIHLLKKDCDAIGLNREASQAAVLNLEKLALLTEGFSGAEIESLIIDALYTAFDKNQPLSIELIFEAAEKVIPLSVTMKNDVEKIRSMVLNGRLKRA